MVHVPFFTAFPGQYLHSKSYNKAAMSDWLSPPLYLPLMSEFLSCLTATDSINMLTVLEFQVLFCSFKHMHRSETVRGRKKTETQLRADMNKAYMDSQQLHKNKFVLTLFLMLIKTTVNH